MQSRFSVYFPSTFSASKLRPRFMLISLQSSYVKSLFQSKRLCRMYLPQVLYINSADSDVLILYVTAYEIASQSIGVCIHTHYKEVIKCSSGEMVTRSCDRTAYLDEQSFWHFEGSMLGLSAISTICVIARRRVLNKRSLQRMQRQLANSV